MFSNGYGAGASGGYGGGGKYEMTAGQNLKKIDWDTNKLLKFDKDFYRENPIVTARPQQEIDQYNVAKEITTAGMWFCLNPYVIPRCVRNILVFTSLHLVNTPIQN